MEKISDFNLGKNGNLSSCSSLLNVKLILSLKLYIWTSLILKLILFCFLCFLLILFQSESRNCIYEIPREQTSIVSKSVLLKYSLDQNSWSRGKIFHMLKWLVKLNIYLYQTSKICLNIILIGNYENLQFDETNFIWQLLLNINLLEILKKA